MFLKRTLLPSVGNGFSLLMMPKIVLDEFQTLFWALVANHFFSWFKHFVQGLFPTGDQCSAHTCGLIEPHVVCIGRNVSMMIERNLGFAKYLVHLATPRLPHIAPSDRRSER